MGKVYDDWGRLVEAVLRREKLRQLCYAQSMSSSDSSCRLEDDDFSQLHAKMTMGRLQEELIYNLTQNKQCFEHGYTSLPTAAKDEEFISTVLVTTSPRLSISSESEEWVLDLLDPDMIPQIKAIADIMFEKNYDKEFCEVFVRFGKAAFGVYFTILDVEELNIDDVSPTGWKSGNSTIKKWCFAIEKFIDLYLCKARVVFDHVLGEYGHVGSSCLIEASKPSLMWFLNFGRVVAVRPHRPEDLFGLLDMYEALVELIPSVEALFPNETGSCILVEFRNLLAMLEDCAKAVLMEFGNAIQAAPTSTPLSNGGIHPLTKYVANYIVCFGEYDHTLNLTFKEKDCEDVNADHDERSVSGALAAHLHSITSALEAKIGSMSDLYQDTALKHMFVMNNIHYMVAKIDNSKMKAFFGDEWIRRLTVKFRVHAQSYQRCTWSSILSLLPVDLLVYRSDEWSVDYRLTKAKAKAICRKFAMAFENVYKNQTRWLVPNLYLRQELRISASIPLVIAYRSFIGRWSGFVLANKHILYSADEIESLILDLLEGSSKSLKDRVKLLH